MTDAGKALNAVQQCLEMPLSGAVAGDQQVADARGGGVEVLFGRNRLDPAGACEIARGQQLTGQ
jgi:hypothetical protein